MQDKPFGLFKMQHVKNYGHFIRSKLGAKLDGGGGVPFLDNHGYIHKR